VRPSARLCGAVRQCGSGALLTCCVRVTPPACPVGACRHAGAGPPGACVAIQPLRCRSTDAGADAWRWLQVQGGAVKRAPSLWASNEDAEQLALLLLNLPQLEYLDADLGTYAGASAAAFAAFLAGAARTIGRCARLQDLRLRISLAAREWDERVLEARELAEARTLERLMTGLAGLSQLRELSLALQVDCLGAPLPACLSCLAQLTSLHLHGLAGLRCAPGWANLPALERLDFEECHFERDGEEALPGMDALVSLTTLRVDECSGLRVLPASLWRLTRLCCLKSLWSDEWGNMRRTPRSELPVAGLPASAPCFSSLTDLCLRTHNLAVFPAGILTATRLAQLDLSYSCFSSLPKGMSVLTALEGLHLGRYAAAPEQIGGALDVRALGSLARFPKLRCLSFVSCSVRFCSDFQAAAAHPCLECLELEAAYPASGPSCLAFLGFVGCLRQQGRSDVLAFGGDSILVEGKGRQASRDFRAALRAVGYLEALSDEE